jgi:hypothetical protein
MALPEADSDARALLAELILVLEMAIEAQSNNIALANVDCRQIIFRDAAN